MGAGTRVKQYERRFGLGQPVDTYGEPCPHIKAATQVKETAEALRNKDIIEAQIQIYWKQAINETVQGSNLKALAGVAEDLKELKSHYKNRELGFVLKGTTTQGNNIRVAIPPFISQMMMAGEGPTIVKIINTTTEKTCSFYKAFHNLEDPNIDIPKAMTNSFRANQEVVVKMKQLPIWDFMSQLEGKASEAIKFNKDGILVANLSGKEMMIGGKEIPFGSFEYEYLQGKIHVEFKVKDITGKIERFRIYDSGFEEPNLTIQKGHGFDKVVNVDYDPKRDSLTIEYNHHKSQNCFTKMCFMEPPNNIDLITRRIPEEMRLRWKEAVKSENTKEMGNIGAEVAAKIAEKEYDVKVPLSGKTTGPDGEITINREPGVFEAKSTADKSEMGSYLGEAEKQVQSRNKAGIAISVYIDMDTGFFEYEHKYVPKPSKLNRYEGGEP